VPETHEWTDTRFPEQTVTIVFETTTRLSHHTDFETLNIRLETACRVHNREVKRGDEDRFEEIKADYMAKTQAAAMTNGNNGKPFELHYTPIGGNCSTLQAQASESNGV
ncbi:MAG: hypothetical protein M1835_003176, partial [Candelina submexicana]